MPILERFLNLCSPVEGLLDAVLYDEHADGFITGRMKDREEGDYNNKSQKVKVAWPSVEQLGLDLTRESQPVHDGSFLEESSSAESRNDHSTCTSRREKWLKERDLIWKPIRRTPSLTAELNIEKSYRQAE